MKIPIAGEEVDVVKAIRQDNPDRPVGVTFKEHAAIYFLPRDEPHFSVWLMKLQESQRTGTAIRFTYTDAGQMLTSVEIAQ